jgi:hypothetical protein
MASSASNSVLWLRSLLRFCFCFFGEDFIFVKAFLLKETYITHRFLSTNYMKSK